MQYISLFFISLISATLLPMGSEAFFLLLLDSKNLFLLLLFASIGNTLGSVINYFLGRKGIEFLLKKKLIKPKLYMKSKNYFDKYGGYSLLLSWMPIIGDPITFFAGTIKYSFKKFLLIVLFAKSFRYLILAIGYNFSQ